MQRGRMMLQSCCKLPQTHVVWGFSAFQSIECLLSPRLNPDRGLSVARPQPDVCRAPPPFPFASLHPLDQSCCGHPIKTHMHASASSGISVNTPSPRVTWCLAWSVCFTVLERIYTRTHTRTWIINAQVISWLSAVAATVTLPRAHGEVTVL